MHASRCGLHGLNAQRSLRPCRRQPTFPDFLAGLEVMLDVDEGSREQALEAVARQLASAAHVDADVVYRALWRREQAGSTASGATNRVRLTRQRASTPAAASDHPCGDPLRVTGSR
jgi:hypothetical protein